MLANMPIFSFTDTMEPNVADGEWVRATLAPPSFANLFDNMSQLPTTLNRPLLRALITGYPGSEAAEFTTYISEGFLPPASEASDAIRAVIAKGLDSWRIRRVVPGDPRHLFSSAVPKFTPGEWGRRSSTRHSVYHPILFGSGRLGPSGPMRDIICLFCHVLVSHESFVHLAVLRMGGGPRACVWIGSY